MALPRLVTRRSTAPVSQDRMPSPAADWYTVIVTRSRALAASNTTPAMLLPTNDAMSEHCRSKAAHAGPARPWRPDGGGVLGPRMGGTGRAGGPVREPGGLIRAWMPPVAGGGVGTEGLQMLFRSPMIPLEPCAQNPISPPM